MIINLILA